MTNDDAKYREWWEKLKGELSSKGPEPKRYSVEEAMSVAYGRVLNRMLQIEAGK